MSKRLQVLLEEREFDELRATAARHGMTVSEWVRQAVRDAGSRESDRDATRKLAALRAAMRHDHPTADIEQMLLETEMGFVGRA